MPVEISRLFATSRLRRGIAALAPSLLLLAAACGEHDPIAPPRIERVQQVPGPAALLRSRRDVRLLVLGAARLTPLPPPQDGVPADRSGEDSASGAESPQPLGRQTLTSLPTAVTRKSWPSRASPGPSAFRWPAGRRIRKASISAATRCS